MNRQDLFERVLVSLQEAAMDDALWPSAAALLDEACGVVGHSLYVGEGFGSDARVHFAGLYSRGQRNVELERDYVENYYAQDERVPRIRMLPAGKLVHVRDVYSAQELKSSATYNEAVVAVSGQNGLHVRMDGPRGCRITWTLHDPVRSGGWGSNELEMIARIVPHIQRCVQVRQALVGAEAMSVVHSQLLANASLGVIELDGLAQIVGANDRALGILRRGDGLSDEGGVLRALPPADDERLQRLLARAVPGYDRQGAGGSMPIRRARGRPPFRLHFNPVSLRRMDVGARRVAALALSRQGGSGTWNRIPSHRPWASH